MRPSLRRSGYGRDLYPRAAPSRGQSDFLLHRSSADGSATPILATPTSGPGGDFRSTGSDETNGPPADDDGEEEVDDDRESRGVVTLGISGRSSSLHGETGSSCTGGGSTEHP